MDFVNVGLVVGSRVLPTDLDFKTLDELLDYIQDFGESRLKAFWVWAIGAGSFLGIVVSLNALRPKPLCNK